SVEIERSGAIAFHAFAIDHADGDLHAVFRGREYALDGVIVAVESAGDFILLDQLRLALVQVIVIDRTWRDGRLIVVAQDVRIPFAVRADSGGIDRLRECDAGVSTERLAETVSRVQQTDLLQAVL